MAEKKIIYTCTCKINSNCIPKAVMISICLIEMYKTKKDLEGFTTADKHFLQK